MTLIFIECIKIRLNGFSSRVEKNNAYSIARNPADKALRVLQHSEDTPVKFRHVERLLGGQHAEVFRRKAAVARNIGKHFFRRLAWKPAHGGANRGPKRKDGFMNGHEINNVARLTPVGGGGSLIRGQVRGMQHVTEKVIPLRREKAERGIVNPFQSHPVAKVLKLRFTFAGDDLLPRKFKPRGD